ncbi:hypothetical protein J3458_000395 [Metarhizium acridum]|uniref:uncharacterized protein n=1 Tax=Metarhizium acridum TaxID=92637 RepID=UPI001C6A9F7E|nr:hypothetical protein J3458_000395 [Metarhizium acridum]
MVVAAQYHHIYSDTWHLDMVLADARSSEESATYVEISGRLDWYSFDNRGRLLCQALLDALPRELHGKITGLDLPKTSIEVNQIENNSINEAYFRGELENAGFAAKVFKKTCVVQYVNSWPDG